MALVDPNIALSYKGVQLQDPLNQYSKASAAQFNALKMEEIIKEREALAQIQSTIASKGGPTDLRAAAQAMFKTGRPEFVKTAVSILERLDNQDQFNQYLRQTENAPTNALAPAPAPAPTPTAAPAPTPAPAPANALTPAPTPAAAPTNALATPTPSSQELQRRYRMVSNINTPAAKAEAQLILKQIENDFRATLPPETIRTMTSLGYPATPEGYQAFQGAQRPPQQPAPLVPVLQNGRPTLVPRDQAVGQTPFSPAAVQVLGLGPGREPKEPPAPTLTTIQDPTNPNQMITIDARQYGGGGVGSVGVIGLAGKTPAATAAANKREEGQQQAGDILDTLETAYNDLDRMKAVPSQRRSAITNALSYVAGTGVGQVAGRVVGSEAQTQRDIIQSSRNQLLNAVKNATGMSAQQLNSNVEFRSWLEALSDPTRSIEANRAILGNMRRFIANNTKKDETPAPSAAPSVAPTPARPSSAPKSSKGAKDDPLGIR
jgi:hypothetical protein